MINLWNNMDLIKRHFLKLFYIFFISSFTYGTCAYAQDTQSNSEAHHSWVLDTSPGNDQWKTEETRARIVIFRLARDQDTLASKPLNIFLNGHLHTSLLPEHQAVALSLCPGKKELSVVSGDVKNPLRAVEETPYLEPGTLYFYQVAADDQAKMVARWVDRDQAKQVLANVKVQMHMVSRVVDDKSCPTGIYSISSSALFKLNRNDRGGMLPGAAQTLQKLAERIGTDYKTLDKVIVKGYADPLGREEFNQRLSEKRAETIASLLIELGLPENVITSQGMGATHLLVDDCQSRNFKKKQLIECNQPNRRVEVEVYGTKQHAEG
ncbi:OmpA family protein [Enterobacter pasteurii]|nr:OmpA family protein [Enterobacter pasteurii]